MIKCLENGIIPHVILDDGKDEYELELDYTETDVNPESTKAADLSSALHAGVIPEAYKDVITDIEVKEVRRLVKDENEDEADCRRY